MFGVGVIIGGLTLFCETLLISCHNFSISIFSNHFTSPSSDTQNKIIHHSKLEKATNSCDRESVGILLL
ncbi:MAG: hypothetical protein Q9M97_09620 [Candidatus Gracilibacteria bacterium]|nr:hypothetical protein [Candidatus Gracilibacteria bacterium]